MPTYCYASKDGLFHVERFFPMERQPRWLTIRGHRLYRDIAAEQAKTPHFPANWPMFSEAMGVLPKQIPAMREALTKRGVNADFTPDGRIKLESPAHRRQVARALGFHDKNAGFSDPVPD